MTTTDVATLATGLQLMDELERGGVLTDIGIDLEVFEASYDQCEAMATMLGHVRRKAEQVTAWAVGDLIVYSEHRFGEIAPQIAAATGLSEQTLLNLSTVSRKIERERRRPNVKPALHAVVAPLEPAEQDRWLEVAEAESLTRAQLRERIGVENGRPSLRQAAQALVDDAVLDQDTYVVAVELLEALRAAL